MFTLVILFAFQLNATATAVFDQTIPAQFSNADASIPRVPDALAGAGTASCTAPVFEDLDGDRSRDFVTARMVGNKYRVLIVFGSGSGVALLNPPVQPDLLTVHIGDVNNDRIQDIILRSPAASHPIAVWLGRGEGIFEAADQSLFRDDFGFEASPTFKNSSPLVDQDLLPGPLKPVCGKINIGFVLSDPEPDEIAIEDLVAIVLPHRYSSLVLRSPPPVPSV